MSTNGGTPLTASMNFGIASASATNGAFSVEIPATAPTLSVGITGTGLVTRRVYVTPGNRTVGLDAIAQSGGVDLDFYPQLVRHSLEARTALQPLRRWTGSPQVYLRTLDEAGGSIDARTLDSTEQAIRDAVSTWTAGRYSASVTRGTDSREGVSGWITVKWPTDSNGIACGQAD